MSNTKIARSPKCQVAQRFLIQNQYHIEIFLEDIDPKSTNTVEVHPRLFKLETALVRSMFQTPKTQMTAGSLNAKGSTKMTSGA